MKRLVLVVVCLLPCACTDGAALPDAVQRPFTFQATDGVDLAVDGAGSLAVEVVPGDGFHDDVTFSLGGSPAVTADPLALPAGTTAGTMQLHAAHGGGLLDGTMELTATSSAGLHATATVYVTVGATSGLLDPSFGDRGVADGIYACQGVAVAGDASIYVPLYHGTMGDTVLHLTAAGQPDPAFGTAGIAGGPGFPTYVRSSGVDDDGKLLLIGTGPGIKDVMVRIGTDGALDPTFGTAGVVALPAGIGPLAGVRAGAILLSLGESTWRFRADGTVDATYGTNGSLTLAVPEGFGGPSTPLDDGSWLLVGRIGKAGAAVHVDAGGQILASATSTVVETRWSSGVADRHGGFYLLEEVGPFDDFGDPSHTRLVHLGPDLALDPAFAHGGRADDLPPVLDLRLIIVGVQPDGKPVVTAASTREAGNHLFRYRADGLLDPTFRVGGTGLVELIAHGQAGGFSPVCYPAMDPQGRILWPGSGLVRILP